MRSLENLQAKERIITINNIPLEEFVILIEDKGVKSNPHRSGPPVVPKSVQKAADDLQKYLYLLTGIEIPITHDTENVPRRYEIIVGKTKRAQDRTDYSVLGDEGYRIANIGDKLLITGGKRGVLYGVYSFLEKYLGMRFFTQNCEKVKIYSKIDISSVDEIFIPPFEYREIMFWNAWNPDFSVKQKINGTFTRKLDETHGYGVGFVGGFKGLVHTMEYLVPEKYFSTNPEYFSLRDGQRNKSQLCLSEPGTLKVALENVMEWLKAEPSPEIISVSVNDNYLYCQCERCKIINDEEESLAGTSVRFVNEIADAVKKVYPHVMVEILIYSFIKVPPKKTRIKDNVAVRLCSYGCRNHALEECEERVSTWNGELMIGSQTMNENIKEWSQATKKLYIWDYVINFFKMNSIYPNFHTLMPNIRYFRRNNAIGVYAEGSTESASFYGLRVYLLAKILWNPDMTDAEFEKHTDEFLEGCYGAGWRHIKEFMALCKKEAEGVHFGIHSPINYVIPIKSEIINGQTVYNMTFIDRAYELFKQAGRAAVTAEEKRNIDKAKAQLDYYALYQTMDERVKNGSDEEKQVLYAECKQLYSRMRAYGFKRLVENYEMPLVEDFTRSPKYWEPQD